MVAHNVAVKSIERVACLMLGTALGLAACSNGSVYGPPSQEPAAAAPDYEARLVAAGTADGRPIDAQLSLETQTGR